MTVGPMFHNNNGKGSHMRSAGLQGRGFQQGFGQGMFAMDAQQLLHVPAAQSRMGFQQPLQQSGGFRYPQGEKGRVLLFRRLPDNTTTQMIENWINMKSYRCGNNVKRVKSVCVLLLKDGVALAELENISMAESIIQEAQANPHSFRMGNNVISVHYSTKQQLSKRPTASTPPPQQLPRVLLILLKELTAKCPLNEIFWICSQFGKVDKVSFVGSKGKEEQTSTLCDSTVNVTQASGQVLVQFSDPDCAKRAMQHLNGRRLAFETEPPGEPGSCMVHVSPARVGELTFRVENELRRDYNSLNAFLATIFPDKDALSFVVRERNWRTRDYIWDLCWVDGGELDPKPTSEVQRPVVNLAAEEGTVLKLSGLPLADGGERIVTPKVMFKVAAVFGDIVAVKFCYRSPGCCLLQYRDGAMNALKYLGQLALFGRKCSLVPSHHRNATNWSVSEMQKLMYTLNEEMSEPAYHGFITGLKAAGAVDMNAENSEGTVAAGPVAVTAPPEWTMFPPSVTVSFFTFPLWMTEENMVNLIANTLYDNVPRWRSREPGSFIHSVDLEGSIVTFTDPDVAFVATGHLNRTRILLKGPQGETETVTVRACFCPPHATVPASPLQQQPSPLGGLLAGLGGTPTEGFAVRTPASGPTSPAHGVVHGGAGGGGAGGASLLGNPASPLPGQGGGPVVGLGHPMIPPISTSCGASDSGSTDRLGGSPHGKPDHSGFAPLSPTGGAYPVFSAFHGMNVGGIAHPAVSSPTSVGVGGVSKFAGAVPSSPVQGSPHQVPTSPTYVGQGQVYHNGGYSGGQSLTAVYQGVGEQVDPPELVGATGSQLNSEASFASDREGKERDDDDDEDDDAISVEQVPFSNKSFDPSSHARGRSDERTGAEGKRCSSSHR